MKVLASLLSILVALTAIGGATLAWFTHEKSIVNEFTAGTVEIDVKEKISKLVSPCGQGDFSEESQVCCDPGGDWHDGASIDNWNPGDCYNKQFRVTNVGTKRIYLRGALTGAWQEKKNNNWVAWSPPADCPNPVEITLVDSQNWQKLEDHYYYKGFDKGVIEGGGAKQVILEVNVCLKGSEVGNEFQGKRFILTAKFEAIQVTNGAVADQWKVIFQGNKWVLTS